MESLAFKNIASQRVFIFKSQLKHKVKQTFFVLGSIGPPFPGVKVSWPRLKVQGSREVGGESDSLSYPVLCTLLLTPWTIAPRLHRTYTFQDRMLLWVAVSLNRRFSSSGIKPESPALQMDSLPRVTTELLWITLTLK